MDSHQSDRFKFEAPRSKFRSFLMRDWPYLLMLALALAGVARTSIGPSSMASYWVVLAPVYGIICVAVQRRDIDGPQAHWQLIRTQARICVVGAVLGLATPAIAWLETSTVLILLVLVVLVTLAVWIFLHNPAGLKRGAGQARP
jgi:hypothetical protein